MKKLFPLVVLIALSTGYAVGCGSYYRVQDTASGSTYFTRDVKHKGGAVRFEDAKTGDRVNIQNAQITRITKNQYKSATGH